MVRHRITLLTLDIFLLGISNGVVVDAESLSMGPDSLESVPGPDTAPQAPESPGSGN